LKGQDFTKERPLVGLIGANIMKSLSPALIEDAFDAIGARGHYHLMDLDLLPGRRLEDVFAAVKAAGFVGINITRPVKEAIMPLLDDVTPEAREIGAVNTVLFRKDGHATGYNTDRTGFRRNLENRLGRDSVAGKPVVLIGAGGAGRAVSFALLDLGASTILLFDSDNARADRLVADLTAQRGADRAKVVRDLNHAIASAAGIVNATPVGMIGIPGNPAPGVQFKASQFAADVIYTPLETEFIMAAKRNGAETVTGDGMLLYQAVEVFELFTGVRPDADRMLAVLKRALAEREAVPLPA
jgi:shikimate dehydrogenase